MLSCFTLANSAEKNEEENEEEIVVVGRKKKTAKLQVGSDNVVKTSEVIESGKTLSEELSSKPGITVRETGGIGQMSLIQIRGSNPSQAVIFLDGIPLSAGQGSSFNLSNLPLAGFSQIEIYKGAVPIEYGGSGPGGVLNLVPAPSGKNTWFTSYKLGSWSTNRISANVNSKSPFPWTASLDWVTSAGDYRYFTNGGTLYTQEDDKYANRINNYSRILRAFLSGKYSLVGGEIKVHGLYTFNLRGIPGPEAVVTENASYQSSRYLAIIRYNRTFRLFDFSGWFYNELLRDYYRDLFGEIGLGRQNDRKLVNKSGIKFKFRKSYKQHQFTLVPHFYSDLFLVEKMLMDLPLKKQRRYFASLGGQYDFSWRKFQFLAGYGFLKSTYQDWGGKGEKIHSWFFKLKYNLENFKFSTSVAKQYRLPSFLELFGDSGGIKGNSELSSENSLKGEISLSWKQKFLPWRLQIQGSLFKSRIENLIQFVPNSQFVAIADNIGKAGIWGVESYIKLARKKHFETRLGLTWLDHVNLSDISYQKGNKLPGRSDLSLYWKIKSRFKLGSFYLIPAYSLYYLQGGYFDSSERRPMPSKLIHRFSLNLQPFHRTFNLSFHFNNFIGKLKTTVTQTGQANSTSIAYPQSVSNYLGYPLPGRSFFINLAVKNFTIFSKLAN
ncbi:MAG: TonB-dependent receptor plug domain-containing protein [Myxococcota bacterium]